MGYDSKSGMTYWLRNGILGHHCNMYRGWINSNSTWEYDLIKSWLVISSGIMFNYRSMPLRKPYINQPVFHDTRDKSWNVTWVSMGVPPKGMVYFRKNPIWKWTINGVAPFMEAPTSIDCFVIVPLWESLAHWMYTRKTTFKVKAPRNCVPKKLAGANIPRVIWTTTNNQWRAWVAFRWSVFGVIAAGWCCWFRFCGATRDATLKRWSKTDLGKLVISIIDWLVVWLPFGLFSHILGC